MYLPLQGKKKSDHGQTKAQVSLYKVNLWGKGYSHLISTTIKEYFDGDSIETKKEFTYDPERPYNIISEKTTPENEEIIKNMYYSNNVLPENNGAEGKNELPDNCYKTAVIQQTISRNNTTISSTLNLYTQVKIPIFTAPYKQYVLNKDNIMEKEDRVPVIRYFRKSDIHNNR